MQLWVLLWIFTCPRLLIDDLRMLLGYQGICWIQEIEKIQLLYHIQTKKIWQMPKKKFEIFNFLSNFVQFFFNWNFGDAQKYLDSCMALIANIFCIIQSILMTSRSTILVEFRCLFCKIWDPEANFTSQIWRESV